MGRIDEKFELDGWLRVFPRERVVALIEYHEGELQKLKQALSLYDSLHVTEVAEPATNGTGNVPVSGLTMRQKVLAVLRSKQNVAWPAAAIKAELVQRRWLDDDQASAGKMYAMLSDMFKKGQLSRPKPGYYRLIQPAQPVLAGLSEERA